MVALIDRWSNDATHEDGMTDEHAWIWREMIAAVPPIPADGNVLDVGCNQGGFLRMLYNHSPFTTGVGIDLARDAIELAKAQKGERPLKRVWQAALRLQEPPKSQRFLQRALGAELDLYSLV